MTKDVAKEDSDPKNKEIVYQLLKTFREDNVQAAGSNRDHETLHLTISKPLVALSNQHVSTGSQIALRAHFTLCILI